DISFDGTQRKHLGAALCFRVGLPLDLTHATSGDVGVVRVVANDGDGIATHRPGPTSSETRRGAPLSPATTSAAGSAEVEGPRPQRRAHRAALIGYGVWLIWTDAPAYQFLLRLYLDKKFLGQTLRQWGILAPVIFMGVQALQVVVARSRAK